MVRFPAKRVSFLTSNNIQCSYEPVFLRFCDAYHNDTQHNELNCDTQHKHVSSVACTINVYDRRFYERRFYDRKLRSSLERNLGSYNHNPS